MLIKDATIITFDPIKILEQTDVRIEGNIITEIGQSIVQQNDEEIINAKNMILMPGLTVSHHHFYSGLARGIMADIDPTPDFASTLKNLWWRMDRALDKSSLYSSAIISCIDAIKCGTTSVIDHHSSPSYISGSLNVIKEAFENTGLRGASCYETTDRNGSAATQAAIEENIRFAKGIDAEKKTNKWKGLVEAHIGGHAPFTLEDLTLKYLADAVEGTGRGFHTHIAEDRYDVSQSHAQYGVDPLKRLDSFGLINEKSLLVHGLFLNLGEISLINSKNAWLVHNPRSNMNNSVGYNKQISRYANCALGTDGIGGDMFEELKFAYFKHRDAGGLMMPGDFLNILHSGNRILKSIFDMPFGCIKPGYAADLILCDYNPPTPLLAENIAGHMIFGMNSGMVDTVIINGKPVMTGKKLSADMAGIYDDASKEAAALWKRMNTIKP